MNNSKKISTGLTDLEVLESAKKHGTNSVEHTKKNHFLTSLVDIVKEPMFLLLFTATSIYFITGDYGDGIFMAIAIVFVIAISVFQVQSSYPLSPSSIVGAHPFSFKNFNPAIGYSPQA